MPSLSGTYWPPSALYLSPAHLQTPLEMTSAVGAFYSLLFSLLQSVAHMNPTLYSLLLSSNTRSEEDRPNFSYVFVLLFCVVFLRNKLSLHIPYTTYLMRRTLFSDNFHLMYTRNLLKSDLTTSMVPCYFFMVPVKHDSPGLSKYKRVSRLRQKWTPQGTDRLYHNQ